MRFIETTCFLLFSLSFLCADILNVPSEYSSIQAAIDSSSAGDTVLVDNGLYNESIDYHGKQLVVASLFLTTGDTSHISNTIIEGNADTSVVSIQSFEPEGTQLIGFSIRNGLGNGNWPNVRGGGIHMRGATAQIKYCYIYNNTSTGNSNRGAGIHCTSGSYISHCKVYNNTSSSNGGIWVANGSNGAIIDNCQIYNNNGGGILITYSSNITVSHTLISGNDGYGIRNFATDTEIINNTIAYNTGNSLIHSNNNRTDSLILTNSIIYANADTLVVQTDSLMFARYSIVEQASAKSWFGEGCLDGDPLFADSLFFNLTKNSPAIDAGDPLSAYDADNSIADMGYSYWDNGFVSGISDATNTLKGYQLLQNYPNPFNPTTKISYKLPASGKVVLKIYDLMGREVKTLVNQNQHAEIGRASCRERV